MLLNLCTLILSCLLAVRAQLDGLLVPTRQGPVLGTLVIPTVRQFLGIPYAVTKRWEAPTLPPVHIKPLTANKFSDSCLQALNAASVEFLRLAGAGNDTIFVPESEDCLTVNIWAPSIRRKQRSAVLLWVYGGGFQFGTSNIPTYNGQNIVRDHDDILVVTFNYRLNIFGFPNAPQLVNGTHSQNFGLLDLDAVVQWVHDNIAAFGGDPQRVTLFGQSAGGVAIDAYTFAHPHDTRIKGVIEQSGSLSILGSTTPLNTIAWNTVATIVGCGNVTNAAQLSCMKQVAFRTLEDAVITTNTNFGLVVDDVVIFSDIAARSASGEFLRVPLLGGTTEHEGDIFVVGAEEVAAGIVIPNLTELLSDLQTQFFTCNAGSTTNDRVKAGVPTWRYQYQAVFPDISTRPDIRAYHASEIPIVFGTFPFTFIPNPPPASTEIALSKFVQSAWVAFARDPTHGLVDFGWPMYSPNTASLAQLGNFFNETGATFTQGQLLDFTCKSLPTLVAVSAQLTALLGPAAANIGSL